MAQHHYTGLSDAEVLESRRLHGSNVLTPPAEESVWEKIKNCMHFWLLKVDLAIFGLAVIVALGAVILHAMGLYVHEGLWEAPVLSAILFVLTYIVAYLGGDYDEEEKKFNMDPLFTILLFALLLSGGISMIAYLAPQQIGGDLTWNPLVLPLPFFWRLALHIGWNPGTKKHSRA